MMQVRQATAPACWSDRAVWSCRADGAVRSVLAVRPDGAAGSGEDRIQTAAALSRASFQPGVPVAFIATQSSFADALSAGPAAAELGGPILLAGQDLPGATAEELARLRPERVVMVDGEAAVSGAVAEQLASFTEGAVDRFAGADRFATSAAVSAQVFEPGVPVFAATGGNFPDALAGGPRRHRRSGRRRHTGAGRVRGRLARGFWCVRRHL